MRRRWRGEGSSHPLVLPAPAAKAIARRDKTQLRRATQKVRLDDGRRVMRASGMREGATYELLREDRARDQEPLASVVVSSIAAQQLGDMTPAEAKAEGHSSLADFATEWMRRRDTTWPPQTEKLCSNCGGHKQFTDHAGEPVTCTACNEVGVVMVDELVDDEVVVDRFLARFAERWVWVVSLEIDERLFLHRVSEFGYTSDPREALEPEAPVLGEPSIRWRSNAEARRRSDLADVDGARLSGLSTIDDQLHELRLMAAERGVDLTRERHVVDQALKSIERKLDAA